MRALLPLAILGCATTASSEPRKDDAPLVIELFTSQGCSSCPPADALVNEIARAGELNGRAVVPLTFHVDYWDDLGWADPYASAAWTERQREYAAQFNDRVYTPELVVGGTAAMVGSSSMKVTRAIALAPRQQKLAARATWGSSTLRVEATAPAGADLYVAIWQDGTRTNVLRGENAGEMMSSDRVVRRLVRVAHAGKRETASIAIDPGWGSALGAVAFAQQGDRTIVGATLLPRTR